MRDLLLLLIIASVAGAQTPLTVPGTHATIQSAIDAAAPGDEIIVMPGTYLESLNFLGKAIIVRSAAGPDVTTIDAQAMGRVVTFTTNEGPTSILWGFTIRGGRAPDGASANMASPGGSGGGILCVNSSPTILDCVIRNNVAGDGGDAVPISTLSGVIAGIAGPGGYGGGVFVSGGAPLIVNCVIRNNFAGDGGVTIFGIFASDGQGGGVAAAFPFAPPPFCFFGSQPQLKLVNCTVVDNTSSGLGGGLYACPSSAGEIANCIVRDNSSSVSPGMTGSQIRFTGLGPSVHHSNVQGGHPGVANFDAAPWYVDAAADDFRLRAGSPGIDAGDSAGWLPLMDPEGDPRIVNDAVDVGADEFCLLGSAEDFVIAATLAGGGDPSLCVRDAAVGDVLTLDYTTPQGTFLFAPAGVVFQVFPTGTQPLTSADYPIFHLDPAQVQGADLIPALPPAGHAAFGVFPPATSGFTVRFQAFAVSPMAQNDIFATSRALDFRIL